MASVDLYALLRLVCWFSAITGIQASLTRRPTSATIKVGSSLRLSCSTSYTNVPVVWRWQSPGSSSSVKIYTEYNVVRQFNTLFGVDHSVYTQYDLISLVAVNASYCGTYYCVDNNDGGPESSAAVVQVVDQPQCTASPESGVKDDIITVDCSAQQLCTNRRADVDVIKNSQVLGTSDNGIVRRDAGQLIGATISCVVKNSLISTSCPRISELFPPSNFKIPSTSYHPGATVRCSADGTVPISYQWLNATNATVADGSDLVITDEMVGSTFTFTCKATNVINGKTHSSSRQFTFTVTETTISTPSTTTTTVLDSSTSKRSISDYNDYKSATIALAVVAALSLTVPVVLAVLYCQQRRITTQSLPSRQSTAPVGQNVVYENTTEETAVAYETLNAADTGLPRTYESLQK